jgi:hypothetical protein
VTPWSPPSFLVFDNLNTFEEFCQLFCEILFQQNVFGVLLIGLWLWILEKATQTWSLLLSLRQGMFHVLMTPSRDVDLHFFIQ